jgi:hypothetical protein
MHTMMENDLEKIDGMIARRAGNFADSIQRKLALVVEGRQMLSETINRMRKIGDGHRFIVPFFF